MLKEAMGEWLMALRLGGKEEVAASVERQYRSSGYVEAKRTYLRADLGTHDSEWGTPIPDRPHTLLRLTMRCLVRETAPLRARASLSRAGGEADFPPSR